MDILETLFYLNTLFYAIVTSYYLNDRDGNQEAAAYTSVILVFIALLLIILYHVYTVFSKATCGRITDKLDRECTPPDDDIHELLDVIDHPHIYRPPRLKQRKSVKSTQSVVEVHQPRD